MFPKTYPKQSGADVSDDHMGVPVRTVVLGAIVFVFLAGINIAAWWLMH